MEKKPLFNKPIPILGVTGEFESGKTRFLLSIAPGPDTCIFDTECSSEAYEEVGARRIDVPAKMLERMPGGYKPVDVFQWWVSTVKTIPPQKFRVIALDVAEDIESGLADWVFENPLIFNHTKAQYLKMSGLYWADVKAYWKSILLDLRSRCEIFAFSVHTGAVWGSDNKPVHGKTKPKGKSTLMELATLFLHIERAVRPDGSKPEVPSARVLKSRLSHNTVRDGSLITKSILPPNLPEATPEAIRAYIAKPANYGKLTTAEKAVPVVMTDDDRAAMRLATAQAEADLERLKIERAHEERKAAAGETVAPNFETDDEFDEAPTAEPSMAVNPPAPETETPTSEPDSVAAPPAAETPAVVPPATEPERPKSPRNGRAKLPQGAIADWLKDQPAAVLFADLAAAMYLAYGVDSNKIHLAAKSLRAAGAIKVGQVGCDVWIGLPAAKFPAGAGEPQPPAATPPAASIMPTDTPPTPAPQEYRRPASLPNDLRDSVKQLWHEFAIVGHAWPHDQADATWKAAVLDRYGVFTGNELTELQLGEIERNLVKKINELYAAKGVPLASPFCADLSHAAA